MPRGMFPGAGSARTARPTPGCPLGRGEGGLWCLKVNLQVRASSAAVVAFYEGLGYGVEERVSMGKRLY
jgi:hypothetical protein